MNKRLWTVGLMFAGLCGVLLLAGSAMGQVEAVAPDIGVPIDGEYAQRLPYRLPTDVSLDGYRIDRLIHLMHWFMAVLFVGWGVFFVYCLVRFRQKSGHLASSYLIKARASKWSEIFVAAFEAVVLIGLATPIWAFVRDDPPPPEEEPMRVRVVAEQFAWYFHYPGPDGVFGRTAAQRVHPATNPIGLDRGDPHGEDDVTSQEFHIPVNRPIIAEITSKDVIHSFSIPVLRVKQDAIPGMRIPVWFTAVRTGNFEVACAQLCGNNHYAMKALLVIEDQDGFDAWYEEMSAPPEFFDDF